MERLFDLVENQARQRPGSILLASKVKGVWQTYSCKSVVQDAAAFANALLTLNIKTKFWSRKNKKK